MQKFQTILSRHSQFIWDITVQICTDGVRDLIKFVKWSNLAVVYDINRNKIIVTKKFKFSTGSLGQRNKIKHQTSKNSSKLSIFNAKVYVFKFVSKCVKKINLALRTKF